MNVLDITEVDEDASKAAGEDVDSEWNSERSRMEGVVNALDIDQNDEGAFEVAGDDADSESNFEASGTDEGMDTFSGAGSHSDASWTLQRKARAFRRESHDGRKRSRSPRLRLSPEFGCGQQTCGEVAITTSSGKCKV